MGTNLGANVPPSQTQEDEGKRFPKSSATRKYGYHHCHHSYYNGPCLGTLSRVPARLSLPPGAPACCSDARGCCRLILPTPSAAAGARAGPQEDISGPSVRRCSVTRSWPHPGTQKRIRSLAQSPDISRTGQGPFLCAVDRYGGSQGGTQTAHGRGRTPLCYFFPLVSWRGQGIPPATRNPVSCFLEWSGVSQLVGGLMLQRSHLSCPHNARTFHHLRIFVAQSTAGLTRPSSAEAWQESWRGTVAHTQSRAGQGHCHPGPFPTCSLHLDLPQRPHRG